ncbi:MAG: preprotein translocase subunit SecE [bacterium]|nr:preprotein translocase subunit SecE [bacterium]
MANKIRKFFADIALEAKRIAWPKRRNLVESTLVVIVFIVILAVVILACDKAIELFLDLVLGKGN